MYRVIRDFEDILDRRHEYHVGDVYPRDGFSVSHERLEELSSSDNRRGEALIEKVQKKIEKK